MLLNDREVDKYAIEGNRKYNIVKIWLASWSVDQNLKGPKEKVWSTGTKTQQALERVKEAKQPPVDSEGVDRTYQ